MRGARPLGPMAACVALCAVASSAAQAVEVDVLEHVLSFPGWRDAGAAETATADAASSAFALATSRALGVAAEATNVVCACPASGSYPCVPEDKGCTRVAGGPGVQITYRVDPGELYSVTTLEAAMLRVDYPATMKAELEGTTFPSRALGMLPVSASPPEIVTVQTDVQSPVPSPRPRHVSSPEDPAMSASIVIIALGGVALLAGALLLAYDEWKKSVVTVVVADATARGRALFTEKFHVWDPRDPWPAIARRATLCARSSFEDVGETQISRGVYHEYEEASPTIAVAREFDLFLSCFLHVPDGKQMTSRSAVSPALEHQKIVTASGRHPVDIPFAWTEMVKHSHGMSEDAPLVAERLFCEESPTGVDIIRLREAMAHGTLVGFVFVQKSQAQRGKAMWTRVSALSHMVMASVRTRSLSLATNGRGNEVSPALKELVESSGGVDEDRNDDDEQHETA